MTTVFPLSGFLGTLLRLPLSQVKTTETGFQGKHPELARPPHNSGLGLSEDFPVGYKHIRVHFTIDANVSEEQKQELIEMAKKYLTRAQHRGEPHICLCDSGQMIHEISSDRVQFKTKREERMGITNTQTGTRIDEVADRIYRISTPVREVPGGLSFNQYLVAADLPLLFHTGPKKMCSLVKQAISSVMQVKNLQFIGFSHYECDECGLWPSS